MNLELAGKTAIVTGAGRGLGRAIATSLLAEGANLVVAARSVDELDELSRIAPDRVAVAPCDMQDLDGVANLVHVALSTFGRLDIVVNNAGAAPAGAFIEFDRDQWERLFTVNVSGPAELMRAAGRIFLQQGSGKVLNIASLSGLRGKPLLAAYSASKGALIRMTEAVAAEWASDGVCVNAIAPGGFVTEAQRAVLDDPGLLRRRLRKIPMGRLGNPEELADLACYLVSPRASFVTGATFVVDGGELHRL